MSYITKSPWIIHYDGSSCNGCDIEVLACLTPMYDVERFGIINTGNPKHADIFLITGAINEQNVSVVKQIYEQMVEPKAVAAIGICATSGGVFKDCYNIMGGVDTVIPVDVYVPGCAARPEAIIDGVVRALGALEEKKKAMDKRSRETSIVSDIAANLDGFDLPDGAPPEPAEDPVLPRDDIEVKYFGAPYDGESAAEAGAGESAAESGAEQGNNIAGANDGHYDAAGAGDEENNIAAADYDDAEGDKEKE
jgi:ech hydrogenase subunit C